MLVKINNGLIVQSGHLIWKTNPKRCERDFGPYFDLPYDTFFERKFSKLSHARIIKFENFRISEFFGTLLTRCLQLGLNF